MSEASRTVVCPGSYDPVTNGHIDIITRTARVFDRVVVGVVNNPVRKQKTLFTAEERRQFIVDATAEIDNVEVEVFAALLVDFARDQGAGAIVKGLRAISDFEYEFEMAQLNRKLDPTIESIYVIASPHYSFLSSTGVKEMATFGGDVSDLVPPSVAAGWQTASETGRVMPVPRVGKSLQKAEEITVSLPNTSLPRRLTTC